MGHGERVDLSSWKEKKRRKSLLAKLFAALLIITIVTVSTFYIVNLIGLALLVVNLPRFFGY